MLTTLLEMGRIFRESSTGLKHHRYVKPAPQREQGNDKAIGNKTKFFVVPVEEDGRFDFERVHPTDDEYLIEKLFYLNYKTSDADTYKKYVFGDIFRLKTMQGKQEVEDGNFRFGDENKKGLYRLNSFDRGESDAESLGNARINRFRQSFKEQMVAIETFLQENPVIYLHFDFEGRHWHQLTDEMAAINAKLLGEFIRRVENQEREIQGYVLRKTLYKTLASASEGPSGRVSRFTPEHEYKNKLFENEEQVMDLLYVIDFSTKAVLRKGDVKIIVLPRGKGLKAEQIERFFACQPVESNEPKRQGQAIRDSVTGAKMPMEFTDEIFSAPLNESSKDFAQFDFIFSKAGSGPSSPDVDMIEIPGIERGLLEELSKRLVGIREQVELTRPKSDKIKPLLIIQSFNNILGDTTKAKKKYHNHLFKVLPQIYTGTYVRDDVLLPAFIEKTEFNIRNEQPNFGLLKFDFYFLTRILNCSEDRLMETQGTQSYQIGKLLGRLARQFAGPKSPIKSFEKNYVGLLSRRITSLADVKRLGNDINQKLVMHELAKYTHRDSFAFAEAVNGFNSSKGPYNKDECAFGFFESYFAPLPKKEDGGEELPEGVAAEENPVGDQD